MVAVRDLGDRLEVREVGVRIAEGLEIHELGVVLDRVFEGLRVVHINEGRGDAVVFQGVAQQVVGAAVDVLGGHDVITALRDVAHRVIHGRCAGCHRKAGRAAFERRDAVFEHPLRGVGQASIDVAWVGQPEPRLGMVEIVEHVARGLVDRHGARIARRVGPLLPHMQLERFEMVGVLGVRLTHGVVPLLRMGVWCGCGAECHRTAGHDDTEPLRRNASAALSRFPIPRYHGATDRAKAGHGHYRDTPVARMGGGRRDAHTWL